MLAEQLESSKDDQDTITAISPRIATGSYQPQSPFTQEPAYQLEIEGAGREDMFNNTEAAPLVLNTPFVSEYELEGSPTESFDAALHREIMEEIYDQEFEEALEDLVNDVREVSESRFAGELSQDLGEAERQMALYLKPLEQEVTDAIEAMVQQLIPIDNESLTERGFDRFLEDFEYTSTVEGPAFENFFKRIFKKIKKVAKKGFKILKKGWKAVKKFSPVHIVLQKLKKLVRPLLKRVLKFALNRVPARFRPLAKRLARRFLKGTRGETVDSFTAKEYLELEGQLEQSEAFAADPLMASYTPEVLNAEFDSLITGFILEGEDFEFEPELQRYVTEDHFEGEDAIDDLDKARDRFVQQVMELADQEDPTPQVEQFIPAILAGLKIGIKLIGRKRVVNFLAKLVARLIRRFVGKQAAKPLSRALVDSGLRLVNLESPEELEYEATQVLANTVEETLDMLVSESPPEVFEDETLMEIYVQEAFEKAVARNFPPSLLRKGLRSGAASTGTWVSQPQGRRRRRYKKFTETFEVTVTAPMAREVRTFGGQTLHSFLKEQLGLSIDEEPVKAMMHLYEAVRGTWLSHISKLETNVHGLGSARRAAWIQIHPLTCEAAAVLLPNNLGLCRKVPPRFLANRNRISVGQRFFHLEIPGSRIVRAPEESPERVGTGRASERESARASEVNVTLDFRRKQVAIFDFLSEAVASEAAQHIRAGRTVSALVGVLRSSIGSALEAILEGSPGGHLRINRETPAEENFLATLGPALRFVGNVVAERLLSFMISQIVKQLKSDEMSLSRDFLTAAEADKDGVTLIFRLSRIDEIFAVMTGDPITRIRALERLHSGSLSGVMEFDIRAGFHK